MVSRRRPAPGADRSVTPSPSPAGAVLCRDDEIAEGDARGFLPHPGAPRRVIVTRRAGVVRGWLDNCPHYDGGSPMAWRRDAYLDGSGTYLACHAHGALFDIDSGACVIGPCLGRSLTPVTLRVADGRVMLAAPIDWRGVSA